MAVSPNFRVPVGHLGIGTRVTRVLVRLVALGFVVVCLLLVLGVGGVEAVAASADAENDTAGGASASQGLVAQPEVDSQGAAAVGYETVAVAGGSGVPSAPIEVSYDVSVETGDSETVEVTIAATFPDEYVGEYDVRFHLGGNAEVRVVEERGFTVFLEDNFNRLDWDGSTRDASVTFELSNSRYEITEEWARINVFTVVRDGRHTVDANIVEDVSGGTKGNHMLFIGDYDENTTDVGDYQIRLVRPAGVEPRLGTETILTALDDASHFLDVGGSASVADEDLFIFAHPDMHGGAAALNTFAANAEAGIELWFHEYLHTRQDYRADAEVAWIVEAEATFYQFLMKWKLTPDWDFQEFQSRVGVDPDVGDGVVITDPDTYPDDRAPPSYWKGAAIIGALDMEIRERTDGEATYQDVLRTFNENYRADREEVRPAYPLRVHSDFTEAIEEVVGDPMDDFMETYVFGDETPAPPDDPTLYAVPSVTVTSVDAPETVSENEDLTITLEVENDGDRAITRHFEAYADDDVLGTEPGVTLGPHEQKTVEIQIASIDLDPGETYDLAVLGSEAESTESLTVEEAPEPTAALSGVDIAGKGAAATIAEGTATDVTVEVENVGEAAGASEVTLDIGQEVTTTATTAELEPGQAETITFAEVTGDLAPETYEVTVSTADDTTSGTLTVEAGADPASLVVERIEVATDEIQPDETVQSVSVTVANTGDESISEVVTLQIDGEVVAEQEVELAGGESLVVEFTELAPSGGFDPGTVPISVGVGDETATASVEVSEGAVDDTDDGTEIPGFGPIAAILGVTAAGYLLRRRQQDD